MQSCAKYYIILYKYMKWIKKNYLSFIFVFRFNFCFRFCLFLNYLRIIITHTIIYINVNNPSKHPISTRPSHPTSHSTPSTTNSFLPNITLSKQWYPHTLFVIRTLTFKQSPPHYPTYHTLSCPTPTPDDPRFTSQFQSVGIINDYHPLLPS